MNPDAAADVAYNTPLSNGDSGADPLLPYRRLASSSVQTAIETLDLSHAQLLRQETVHSQALDLDLLAPAACLLTCEAICGDTTPAIQAATALALIESMADVFRDIAATSEENETLLTGVWGMPRALNAGDACFALAQQSILSLRGLGLDDATVLHATGIVDAAARQVCETLAGGPNQARSLLASALSLGALCAGASPSMIEQLEAIGEAIAAGRTVAGQMNALDLPDEARQLLALLIG